MTSQDNDRGAKTEKGKDERQLDKALEDTFPASDPPSVTRAPKDKRETPHEGEPDKKQPGDR